MVQKTVGLVLLTGALAVPLASLASEAWRFPRQTSFELPLVLAQTTDGGNGEEPRDNYRMLDDSPDDPPPADPAVDAIGITPEMTAQVVSRLRAGIAFCNAVTDLRVTVDCLGEQYDAVAKLLPETGGYAKARQALMRTAAKLRGLAAANADPGAPKVTARVGNQRSAGPLTPVANPGHVNREALAIVRDANLFLLRSAAGSNQRRAAYEDVAAAVNSTKVLLRAT